MSESDVTRREVLQASAALAVAPHVSSQGLFSSIPSGEYLIHRLAQNGVTALFGVPGATCDPLFAAAQGKPGMSAVVTSSDLEAGYAADGYARVRGLSAVAVTYGVGTMSLIGVIAGAYAERSPIVVINGGPSSEDLKIMRESGSFFSHSIGKEKTDLALFKEVTGYAERAETAHDVTRVVDTAIGTALKKKRPVYVEIPKHLWEAQHDINGQEPLDVSIPATAEETRVAELILTKLRAAKRPALLLGIELQRFGLVKETLALVQKLGLPWSTTLLAKSVIPETTPGFAGVYSGEKALSTVKKVIEEADALLTLGCVMGRQYRHLATRRETLLSVADDAARVGRSAATPVALGPLLQALSKQTWEPRTPPAILSGLSFDQRRASLPQLEPSTAAKPDEGLTYDQSMKAISDSLDDTLVVITDTSLSMYPAAELNVAGQNAFVCNSVWQSIGFSVGASVGVAVAQDRRPLVICGDGGFQMTAQSLSTMVKQKLRTIVVVLDNAQYGIEQFLLDARYYEDAGAPLRPYLALNRWNYSALAKALGFSTVFEAKNPAELQRALKDAKVATGPAFITATIKRHDLPSQLRRGA